MSEAQQLVVEPLAPDTEALSNDELSKLVSDLAALGFLASAAGEAGDAEEQAEVESSQPDEVHAHVRSICSVSVICKLSILMVRHCLDHRSRIVSSSCAAHHQHTFSMDSQTTHSSSSHEI